MRSTGDIIEWIRRSYGSTRTPNWGFVSRAVARDTYKEVRADIENLGYQTIDITDPQCDTSFCWAARKGRKEWVIRLSMAGPFAIVRRDNDRGRLLHPEGDATTDVIATLTRCGLRILDIDTARVQIPFGPQPKKRSLYGILFEDTDDQEWDPDSEGQPGTGAR